MRAVGSGNVDDVLTVATRQKGQRHQWVACACAVPVQRASQGGRSGHACPTPLGRLLGKPRQPQRRRKRRTQDQLGQHRNLDGHGIPAAQTLHRPKQGPGEGPRVRRGQDGEGGHSGRVVRPQVPRQRASPVVANDVRPLEARFVQQPQDVGGEHLDPVCRNLARRPLRGVPTLVRRESSQAGPMKVRRYRVPAPRILREPMEQDNNIPVARSGVAHVKEQPVVFQDVYASHPHRAAAHGVTASPVLPAALGCSGRRIGRPLTIPNAASAPAATVSTPRNKR